MKTLSQIIAALPDSNKRERFKKTLRERKAFFQSFVGVIKLDEDPLVIQKRWRDEWD